MFKKDYDKKRDMQSESPPDNPETDSAARATEEDEGRPQGAPSGEEAGTERIAEMEAEIVSYVERLAQVAAERDAWQAKATGLYDQYLRSKSDFEAYRKRTERDFEDRLTRAMADHMRSVLDVLDNFDRFLAAASDNPDGTGKNLDAFHKGVSMIYKQLMDALTREGIEAIPNPVGEQMNPEYHEAVAAVDGAGEHGAVLEELQKGYTYKGLVIRPSRVKVAR